ncbi:MAG: flagellar motor switch protein FliN [Desulfatiglandaceae bacterium]
MTEKDKGTPASSGVKKDSAASQADKLDFVLDVPLKVTVELGRTEMVVSELLKLSQGSIIELSKYAGETLDILANQQLIARGEVVVVKDKYAMRITEIVTPMERVKKLK